MASSLRDMSHFSDSMRRFAFVFSQCLQTKADTSALFSKAEAGQQKSAKRDAARETYGVYFRRLLEGTVDIVFDVSHRF